MLDISSALLGSLWMLIAAIGLPMGIPPAPENPAMQQVAPEQCVLYSTWSATAKPDPKSTNHTEQLLAEPEVQEFMLALEKTIFNSLREYAKGVDDPKMLEFSRAAQPWANALGSRSGAFFVARLEMKDNQPIVEAGFLIDGGEQAVELSDSIVKLMTTMEHRPKELMVGRFKFMQFPSPEGAPPGLEVTVGSVGQYVLVGVGKSAVENMVTRLRDKKIPTWLATLQKRLPVERRSSMAYINVKTLVDSFLPMAGPEAAKIAEELGLKQLGVIESVSGLDKEGIVTRTFVQIEGKPRGVWTLLDGKGIQPEQVLFIPKDATTAAAFSFNLQRAYNTITQTISEHVPEGAEQIRMMEAEFTKQFGMGLGEDVCAAFGDAWTFWMSPADGWLGATATVEIRDATKLIALLKKAEAMLGDLPPEARAPRIETSLFRDHPIFMLSLPEIPMFRPSWAMADKRLIFSLSPQSVKAALDTRPNEIGLFSGPQFADAFAKDGSTIAIGYQDTAKVFETTYSYVTLMLPMMMDAMKQPGGPLAEGAPKIDFDIASLPSARSIHRHLRPGVTITRRTPDGLENISRQTFPTPSIGATAPVAVALILPAVQAAREAARRMESQNNLRQIAIAMHNHHDTYKSLPPAFSSNKEGKPLLSWRVHILPYIEQDALYKEFHLDEPWDSEHNSKLIAKMPTVYRCPNSTAGKGETVYLAVTGEKGVIIRPAKESDGHTGGLGIASITDGTSNTIMVLEANNDSAVIWTKPDDFEPDEKMPFKGLIGIREKGFLAAFADGSTHLVQEKTGAEMLLRLLQRNDGQVVELPDR